MKKFKLFLIVLSLSILCGCGASPDNMSTAGGGTKAQTEDNSTDKQKTKKKKIEVGAPDSLEVFVDGEYAYIFWGEGKNATGYEYDFGAGVEQTTDRYLEITGFLPGIKAAIQVRAYNDTEETPVYSEWKTLNITMPEIDLENLSRYSAGALSRTMFEEWAAVHDPDYEMTENDEYYIYTVKFRDEANEGLWNKIKRGGKAAWSNFWQGYAETVDNETADGEAILKGILENRGVKNYISDVDDSATFEGGWRAAKAAWSAMKIDPDCVYIYYFGKDSAKKSAVFFERHCLQKNHENYAKEIAEQYNTVTINGENYYTYVSNDCGRSFYFAVGTEKVQGVDRWVDYAYSDYLYFK